MADRPAQPDSGPSPLSNQNPPQEETTIATEHSLHQEHSDVTEAQTDLSQSNAGQNAEQVIDKTEKLIEGSEHTLSLSGSGSFPAPWPQEGTSIVGEEPQPKLRGKLPTIRGYEILEELGRGGMGVVYKARQEGLNRLVALKMILAGNHAGTKARLRFQAEAEAVARLQHPNIIQIYEVSEQEGYPFISFEYADGGTLAHRLRGAPLPEKQAALLVEIVARAIHVAHQRGIIHRDLKPANILLTLCEPDQAHDNPSGMAEIRSDKSDLTAVMPKVSDFGLAKNLQFESGQTGSGDVMGTPSYMAPEQAAGKVHELGPAVDIYALGAIIYELLTGRPPFRGASPWETIKAVINEEPVSPRRVRSSISRDLEIICMRCLHKDPDRRYESAVELAEDLRRFRSGEAIKARPVGLTERMLKWAKRRPAVAALLATVAMLLIGGWLVLTGMLVQARRLEARARAGEEKARKAQSIAESNEDRIKELNQQLIDKMMRSRRELYAARMHEAQTAYQEGNLHRANEVLSSLKTELNDLCHFEWGLLRNMCGGEHSTAQHARLISDVAFTSDARLMATASLDHTIRIWDVKQGRELSTLRGHEGPVRSIDFSSDGKILASASEDCTVRIWSVKDGKHLKTLEGHQDHVVSLELSEDGKEIVSGSDDATVRVWNLSTGKARLVLEGHQYGVTQVAFGSTGQQIASAGKDKTLRIWSAATGKTLQTLEGHSRRVSCLAFGPEGRWLASGGSDRRVILWDIRLMRRVSIFTVNEAPKKLAFSPQASVLGMLTNRGQLHAWNLSTQQEVALKQKQSLPGLAFHPDGRLLESITFSLKSPFPKSLPSEEVHMGAILAVALSPDGEMLATAGEESMIAIWDRNHRLIHTLSHHTDSVQQLVFSHDGSALASASLDGTVRVWNPKTGQLIHTHRNKNEKWVHALSFSQNSALLASGGEDRNVYLWQRGAMKPLLTLSGHDRAVRAVAIHPNGKRIVSADGGGTIKIWDVESGKEIRSIQAHQGRILALTFSPDGKQLVSSGWDRMVHFWDLQSSNPIRSLAGHAYGVTALWFTSDGERLATASEDKTVKIWDIGSSRELLTLNHHVDGVTDLCIDPKNERLISVGRDQRIAVWATNQAKP